MALYLLLSLFALLGVIFGWIAFFRTLGIRQEIDHLAREVRLLKTRIPMTSDSQPAPNASTEQPVRPKEPVRPPQPDRETLEPSPPRAVPEVPDAQEGRPAALAGIQDSTRIRAASAPNREDWIANLRNNWMIWLGGACIGLAGIFLAKYSIDRGYLGPGARITGGILLGLGFHGLAEWMRRTREPHKALAALAAGGSITLFAAFLAALHLYHLMNVWVVFAGLSIVALATMALALLHGPVLAVLGILGAYLVPVLIGGGAGNALSASVYALIISASALFLMRHVYRSWLWAGMLAGGSFWWFMTYHETGMQIMSGIYPAIFSYLMISIPSGDYLLLQKREPEEKDMGIARFHQAQKEEEKPLPVSLLWMIILQLISITLDGFDGFAMVKYSFLPVLLLLVGSRREYLRLHPWIVMLSLVAGWLLSQLDNGSVIPLDPALISDFYWYSLVTVVIISVFSVFNFRFVAPRASWMSLATITPVLFLALTYLLTTDKSRSLQWGLMSTVLAGFYLALTRLTWHVKGGRTTLAWLFIASHFAYSLAVAMFLRQASMTLALSVQVISLAWVIQKYELKEIDLILKAVVALVVSRLTLNPWLQQYPTDIHWSLWTYGGSTLCCLAGAILLKGREDLEKWTWVAVIHLFALTLWAETRYWLYDGNVYAFEYTFTEAAITMSISGLLGLVYHYRVKTSVILAPLYRGYSNALILFSLFNYALILMAALFNFRWAWSKVGTTPLFNLLLLAYGFPIVLGYLYYRFYSSAFKTKAALVTAVAGFVFITLQVRHLWQGTISLSPDPLDGELYTYSAVWLVIAVACILGGVWRFGRSFYRGGMLLLAIVIAKLFLIDMSDLKGLLRVASFMGMGLGLLGIAYLHQRLNVNKVPASD